MKKNCDVCNDCILDNDYDWTGEMRCRKCTNYVRLIATTRGHQDTISLLKSIHDYYKGMYT